MHRTAPLVSGVLLVGLWLGCLPGDTRPPPAEVFVSVTPSEATTSGFQTSDGWTVTFTRFVTALGDVELDDWEDEEDSCNDYSETNYEWLIDFVAAGREKVGLAHGLGRCSIGWRVRAPSDDTLLGPGVSQRDVAQMLVEAEDLFGETNRASLVVEGSAERSGERKTFAWTFRRTYELRHCEAQAGSQTTEQTLTSEAQVELTLELRGEELFRELPDDGAALVFDSFASADADGDGVVTLAELAEVPFDSTSLVQADDDEEPPPETLGDVVARFSLPRISRALGAAPCEAELRQRRR